MLDRIEVDVIHMVLEVGVVADQVFPIAALPKTALATPRTAGVDAFTQRHPSRKALLDEHEPACKVGIVSWQGHQHMQVLRQDHDGVQNEGMACAHLPEAVSERLYMIQQDMTLALGSIERKEVGPTGDIGTSVAHG